MESDSRHSAGDGESRDAAWERRNVEHERWFGNAAALVGAVCQPLWFALDTWIQPDDLVLCATARLLAAVTCASFLVSSSRVTSLQQMRTLTVVLWTIAALCVGMVVPGSGSAFPMYTVGFSLIPWAAGVSLSQPTRWAAALMAGITAGFGLPLLLMPHSIDSVAVATSLAYMVTAALLGGSAVVMRHNASTRSFGSDWSRLITERELAAGRLAMVEQQALHQARDRFLERMSHELRTPLNAMVGYVEMVREECDEAGLEHCVSDLDRVQESGRHLLALIADILDLVALETGNIPFVPEDVDVSALVDRCTEEVRPTAERKALTLKVDCAGLGTSFCDPTRLRQVLLALLTNAVKFTESGTVTVSGERRHRAICVAVEDTGPGVDPALAERIFESFVQVDDQTTRTVGGTGVGLTVARALARRMNGDILYLPRDTGGSRFELWIDPNPDLAPSTLDNEGGSSSDPIERFPS